MYRANPQEIGLEGCEAELDRSEADFGDVQSGVPVVSLRLILEGI